MVNMVDRLVAIKNATIREIDAQILEIQRECSHVNEFTPMDNEYYEPIEHQRQCFNCNRLRILGPDELKKIKFREVADRLKEELFRLHPDAGFLAMAKDHFIVYLYEDTGKSGFDIPMEWEGYHVEVRYTSRFEASPAR